MIKLFRRWWLYITAKLNMNFSAMADPKVQLEQAITEAQDQHRRLKEQAANVIANQKQTELRLNRKLEELENVNAQTRQALQMAADAEASGNAERAAELTSAAETIANKLMTLEAEIEDLKALHLANASATEQAKAAVEHNSIAMQNKLSERQKLLGQLDQAKMQEAMNVAMAQLTETVGQDVPTFNEVRDKIEARMARAAGAAELHGESVESHLLEIEAATRNTGAKSRLDAMRAEMGIATEPEALDSPTPSAGDELANATSDTPEPAEVPAE